MKNPPCPVIFRIKFRASPIKNKVNTMMAILSKLHTLLFTSKASLIFLCALWANVSCPKGSSAGFVIFKILLGIFFSYTDVLSSSECQAHSNERKCRKLKYFFAFATNIFLAELFLNTSNTLILFHFAYNYVSVLLYKRFAMLCITLHAS